jgi:hypothetical protein
MEAINWTQILLALGVRFIGVFVILAFLMISIQFSGALLERMRKRASLHETAVSNGDLSQRNRVAKQPLPSSEQVGDSLLSEETVAAIALALSHLSLERTGGLPSMAFQGERPPAEARDSSWRILGRQGTHQRAASWSEFGNRRQGKPTGNAKS